MSQKPVSIKIGPGFPGLLTILFIALKLTGYISWSWWWVLSPLWIPLAIVAAIFLVFALIAGVIMVIAALVNKR